MLAVLDMLAFSEIDPKLLASSDGYNVVVGGGLFAGYADYSHKLVPLARLGISSTEAGRYQLLQRYWDAYRVSMKLQGGCTSINQDRIAIQQICERRAIPEIEAGRIRDAIAKIRNI